MEECTYDRDKFMEIFCVNMTSTEQTVDKINTTVFEIGSLPRLIEYVDLQYCDLPYLTISSFRFLSQLQNLSIWYSSIKRLASAEEPISTNEANGMYLLI
ncbi:hypothetical protein ILUMI_02339 [Ignelater luminosus]|uniref:Uncharacterized protein n=1 Tax=Ignelater luminosus TaxID=2038154 RepID=A0A8K0GLF9_IGNLU|nr:hypothetical protein ILUMI_02339 [Ignelater luminosus]